MISRFQNVQRLLLENTQDLSETQRTVASSQKIRNP
ncbi:MAG: hypothetical protein ABEJ65_08015, partial [bacterium]